MGALLGKEFHLRTITGRRYNFCGPNTRLSRRMTPDGFVRDGSEPINRIDDISLRHDIAYRNADEGRGTRLEADAAMLRELKELEKDDLSCDEMMAKCFVQFAIGILYRIRKLFQ